MKNLLSKSFYQAGTLSNIHIGIYYTYSTEKVSHFQPHGKPLFQAAFRSDPTAIWVKIQIFPKLTYSGDNFVAFCSGRSFLQKHYGV